jgi:putative Mg2+ transporter-C (MgtC) family protein
MPSDRVVPPATATLFHLILEHPMASSLWQRISDTVASEFSDIPDVEQATRMFVRLLLAAVLGGLLGIEREQHGKDAGVRTHMLVAMGAALFVLVSQQGGMLSADLSRVVQGVIAGVGFLGAGAILKLDGEERVKGLTTAAGIWLTAAIGVAAGMGREATAVLSTLLTLAIFALVPKLVRLMDKPQPVVARDGLVEVPARK